MFAIGDVIQPVAGHTLLTFGLYRVLHIDMEFARLSRLHVEGEDAMEACYNRTTFVPISMLEQFHRVPLAAE